MNNKTKEIKKKIEKELQEAIHKMNRYNITGFVGGEIHFNYWKKECLTLRKELREINTGRTIY